MVSRGVNKPYIKCIGASATGVTQSCYLVRFKKYALLLDCGMYQEGDPATNYKINAELLKKIRVKEIDYIVLSHCHSDHSGLLPALYARGCNAHLFVPTGSIPFLRLMWEDSAKIMQQDCTKLNKSGIKASPFYDQQGIDRALDRIIEVDYTSSEKYYYHLDIATDIRLSYYSANHIVHACQVHLDFVDGYIHHRLGFTGDIGGMASQPFLTGFVHLPYTNVLIGESTYSSPSRPNKWYDRSKDIEKIEAVVRDSHRVLIPCFSLHRTQVILATLYDMYQSNRLPKDVTIYLDSPLAQKLCAIWPWGEYTNVMKWDRLHQVQDWNESMALQQSNRPCIILAASGMMTAGRSVAWAKAILPDPRNTILFCGYSGPNSLAYEIRHGDSHLVVDGEEIENRANIVELVSFSSHANYEELMDYYANIYQYDKLVLVHGASDSKVDFVHKLQDNLVKQGKSARVICANADTKVVF